MRTADEQAAFERFSKRYRAAETDPIKRIERTVCGCDYGGTSWTTRAEAVELADLLGLKPGRRLLEVGAGSGWPGLFLALQTGCDIALVDLPFEGLDVALGRAEADGLSGGCWAAVADGARLPFADGWFDAVDHSDVLCCLAEKKAVLDSCRRVIGAGGTMVFSVILVTPGLSKDDHELAVCGGPPFVDTKTPYPAMLQQTGWEIADHRDLTAEFTASVKLMRDQEESHAAELAAVFGEDDAAASLTRRRNTYAALEKGLLRRELFVAAPA